MFSLGPPDYVKPTNSSAATIAFQYVINSIAITPFISYY